MEAGYSLGASPFRFEDSGLVSPSSVFELVHVVEERPPFVGRDRNVVDSIGQTEMGDVEKLGINGEDSG